MLSVPMPRREQRDDEPLPRIEVSNAMIVALCGPSGQPLSQSVYVGHRNEQNDSHLRGWQLVQCGHDVWRTHIVLPDQLPAPWGVWSEAIKGLEDYYGGVMRTLPRHWGNPYLFVPSAEYPGYLHCQLCNQSADDTHVGGRRHTTALCSYLRLGGLKQQADYPVWMSTPFHDKAVEWDLHYASGIWAFSANCPEIPWRVGLPQPAFRQMRVEGWAQLGQGAAVVLAGAPLAERWMLGAQATGLVVLALLGRQVAESGKAASSVVQRVLAVVGDQGEAVVATMGWALQVAWYVALAAWIGGVLLWLWRWWSSRTRVVVRPVGPHAQAALALMDRALGVQVLEPPRIAAAPGAISPVGMAEVVRVLRTYRNMTGAAAFDEYWLAAVRAQQRRLTVEQAQDLRALFEQRER